jgi:hypothetical protein
MQLFDVRMFLMQILHNKYHYEKFKTRKNRSV